MKRITLFTLLAISFFIFLSCELDTGYMDIEALTDSSNTVTRTEIEHVVGGIWISPKQKTKNAGDEFKTKLYINTGEHLIGAFGLQIAYNPQVIKPNVTLGKNGVETDVFVLPYGGYAVNILPISPTEERLFIGAYHAYGVDPSPETYLFDFNWIGQAPGETEVTPIILILTAFDPLTYQYYTPGTPTGYPGTVTIK